MFLKLLKPGDRNPWVELLQLALNRSNFLKGGIDGIYGPKTEAAVKDFQKKNNLSQNGQVDGTTWNALFPYLTGYLQHKLVQGDTLYRLSVKYGTSLHQIEMANPHVDPLNLQVGSTVIVPLPFPVVPTQLRFTPTLLEICIQGLTARYPFLEVSSIGQSVMGTDIPCLKIGSGLNEVFYNGSHHANEWITSLLLMKFLEDYCKSAAYSGKIFGERASDLYILSTLYVVPMVNPDGVSLVTGELTQGDYYEKAVTMSKQYPNIPFPSGWKANISGIDLNLQYPAGWEDARDIKYSQGYTKPGPRDYVGSMPLEAPESKAVYEFTKKHNFSLTLSYHTQGQVIYWKYLDYLPPKSKEIGLMFSSVSGYSLEDTPEESAYAGYKDWFISEYNKPGYTIEVGEGTSPLPLKTFPTIYSNNLGILTLAIIASL